MKRKFIALECLLCIILLGCFAVIHGKSQGCSVRVGSFGKKYSANYSLEDLTNDCFRELFYE